MTCSRNCCETILMKDIRNLGARNYYLWSKTLSTLTPWARQYLNRDFYQSEVKRIGDVEKWSSLFHKAQPGEILPNVRYYRIPHSHSRVFSYKKQIDLQYPEHSIIWFSALHNCPQYPIIGLTTSSKHPEPYQLVEIDEPRKVRIKHPSLNDWLEFIVFDEFKQLEPDTILTDVAVEQNIIGNLIKENLTDDPQLNLALQLPLNGTPLVGGTFGGIGSSSYASPHNFNRELISTILRLAPPIYSGTYPSESLVDGKNFTYIRGVKLKFAERMIATNHSINSAFGKHAFSTHGGVRRGYQGDYSVLSSLQIGQESAASEIEYGVSNYFSSDITLPNSFDYYMETDNLDIDLRRLQKEITEDVWIQMAHIRQQNPVLRESNAHSDIHDLHRNDMDVILRDYIKGEAKLKQWVNIWYSSSAPNLDRVSTSIARGEGVKVVGEEQLKKARAVLLENLSDFCRESPYSKLLRKTFPSSEKARQFAMKHVLMQGSENIQGLSTKMIDWKTHTDLDDVTRHLDWFRKRHMVAKLGDRYRWTWMDY